MIVKPEQLSHTLTSFGHREGYLPREAFSYPANYNASLDIFMFGVIITLIARSVPTVKIKCERQELVAKLGQHPLKQCIYQCLNENKEERSNTGELCADLSSLLNSISTSKLTTEKPNVATDNGMFISIVKVGSNFIDACLLKYNTVFTLVNTCVLMALVLLQKSLHTNSYILRWNL